MKKSLISACLLPAMIFLCPLFLPAQQSNNQSLDFDGADDHIVLSPVNFIPPTADFSIEAWFRSTATSGISNYRKLFVLSGPSTLLELGEADGFLNIFLTTPTYVLDLTQVYPLSIRDGNCHHIAMVRDGNQIRIYLDGALTYTANGFSGALINTFFVGGAPPAGFWQGTIDEVRLWTIARSAGEINLYKDCVLSGVLTGLPVYWTLNQGADPGGNNTLMNFADNSGTLGSSYNGALTNFSLNGPASNFVSSPCSPKYNLEITNKPALPTASISTICEGGPVHFGVTENGGEVNTIPGGAVLWEYSDDGGSSWSDVANAYFTGFSFFVPQGVILDDCANNPDGMLERRYRAKISKTIGGQICTYYTTERKLKICCPITGSITLTPSSPTVLCEGTVSVLVQLNGPPYLNNYTIQWYIDGVYYSNYDNVTGILYQGQANPSQLCFEAHIQHCGCPPVTLSACLMVDPLPQCTYIDQISDLMPLPGGTAFDYLICPGREAQLAMFGLPQNSVSVWQFSFNEMGPWTDIGTGNPVLNTNTLPAPDPSIYNWPAGATSIYYRLECRPQSYPLSQCGVQLSNTVKICLKENELPDPVIGAYPNPVCEGEIAFLSLQPPIDPNLTIQWYCGGFPCYTSPIIATTHGGVYQVAVSDGCFTKFSNVIKIKVCDPVAIIKCPEDNPCACYGQPTTIDGTLSYSNCGPIVSYLWEIIDGTGTHTQTGPVITYTFTEAGGPATFWLTVTDSNQCIQKTEKPFTLTPCE